MKEDKKNVSETEMKSSAAKLGISEQFYRLLRGRGLDDGSIPSFLRPSLANLSSPFEIHGMRAAADRIRLAIERKEKILVFGDYDCDGICAISILMLALRDRADVAYFIPNRLTDGYGMSTESLKRITEHRRPDLVITVDCGITASNEVEFLKSKGIDVIVTDHHEPQDNIPDCIVVDAKIDKRGFFDLCGAGVALKLVQALFGDEYAKYLDICAIATVADVVPLVGDNRIIAYFGLKQCSVSPRKGVRFLAGSDAIGSQDVMFRVAPRINAAGRLGSAMKAVDLFLGDDYFLLKSLAEELERDNTRRQEICEQVVREAKVKLRGMDFDTTRIIVLHDSGWEAGVLGIAAARLVEDFKCPAVLFSGDGEEYKGSARSVKNINIFNLLSGYADMFTTFGGHAQAAGVGIRAENFEAFRQAVNAEVVATFPPEDFLPETSCDMRLEPDDDFLSLAKELELLEPTGYGNPKPEFVLTAQGLRFDRIGFGPHVKCVINGLEIMGFSRYGYLGGATKGKTSLEFSMGVSCFQNRVYAQGIMKGVSFDEVSVSDEDAQLMSLHQLGKCGETELSPIDAEAAKELAAKPFGTAFIVFGQSEYERLCREIDGAEKLPVYVGAQKWLNPQTCVVFAPNAAFDFAYFKNAVFAGNPLSEGYVTEVAKSCRNAFGLFAPTPTAPTLSDAKIRAAFVAFDAMARRKERAQSPAVLCGRIRQSAKLTAVEYEICRLILSDLGLISVSDRGIITVCRDKTDLNLSAYYRNVRQK